MCVIVYIRVIFFLEVYELEVCKLLFILYPYVINTLLSNLVT